MALLGLIGGTGLDRWGSREHEIAGETPFGSTSAPLAVYQSGPTRLVFIARHGFAHTIPPHRVNSRANLWALREAGVQHVLAVNAVGGIGEAFAPGRMAVPDQLIDYTWGRTQSFSDDSEADLLHVDFEKPFEGRLRKRLLDAARDGGPEVIDGGCIAVTQGPRLETAAEIRRLRRDGCDVVGMTSMPEAVLARELGLDYACLCVVANWAAGVTSETITMAAIEATLAEAMQHARALIVRLCAAL